MRQTMNSISSSSLQQMSKLQEMQADFSKVTFGRLVASTIAVAADKEASDIHIQPQAAIALVRGLHG